MHPLQKMLIDAGIEIRSYSGRRMFGKTCLAINGREFDNNIGTLIFRLMEIYREEIFDCIAVQESFFSDEKSDIEIQRLEQIEDGIKSFLYESLGKDLIFYFPEVEFSETNEDK